MYKRENKEKKQSNIIIYTSFYEASHFRGIIWYHKIFLNMQIFCNINTKLKKHEC